MVGIFELTWPWGWALWPVRWEALRLPGLWGGIGQTCYLPACQFTAVSKTFRNKRIKLKRSSSFEDSRRLQPHVTSVWRGLLIGAVPIFKASASAGLSRRTWFEEKITKSKSAWGFKIQRTHHLLAYCALNACSLNTTTSKANFCSKLKIFLQIKQC